MATRTIGAENLQDAPPSPGRRARRVIGRASGKGRGERVGVAGLLAYLPLAFLVVFGAVPIVFSLLLVLGHLGGPNSAVSELGQNEIAGHGLGTIRAISGELHTPDFLSSLLATLLVVGVASVVVLVGGAAITIWHRLRPSAASAFLQFVSVVPLFIPVVIASFAIWSFWGDRGVGDSIATMLGLHHGFVLSATLKGVMLAEVWVSLPFAVLLLRAGLSQLSEASLEAARDAGAGTLRTAVRIVVPQIRRECAVVFCFTAVGVLGSFTVPDIVGPAAPLLLGVNAVDTFSTFNEPQQAAVIGFTIFVIAALVGCLYAVIVRSRHGAGR